MYHFCVPGILTLVMLNYLFLFFIHLQLELINQYTALYNNTKYIFIKITIVVMSRKKGQRKNSITIDSTNSLNFVISD